MSLPDDREPTPVDPSHCPLCGTANQCGMAQGLNTCWCFDATIPSEVIDLIPDEARDIACVCRACAQERTPAEIRALLKERRAMAPA